ncbi:MAG TPA: FtsX-like permease family protein, partial [Puia sp.]|nr:FtsX-like permease family protein [Puia sp.]
IREKIAGVAVLRCLGLKSRAAFLIYLIQVLAIGLVGSLLGAGLGVAVQQVLPMLFKDILPVEAHFRLSWPAIGEGIGIGTAIALLFALPPLLAVRKISPLNTLRLAVEPPASDWDGWKATVYTTVFVFITLFSYAQMGKFGKALVFTLSILGAFLLLAGAAKLLMAAVRRFFPERWNYLWRQGFANLYRPNNQTLILVVTIGLGTTFIGTLFFIQQLLLDRVNILASTDGNMVLYDVQPSQIAGVRKLASEMKVQLVDDVPVVGIRYASIKGIPQGNEGAGRRRDYDTRVTYSDTLRPTEKLVAGKLGPPVHSPRDVIHVSYDDDAAASAGLQIGDQVVFDVQGVEIPTVVGSIRHLERSPLRQGILFPSGVLESAPQFHIVTAMLTSPAASARFQRAVVQQFPGILVVDLALVVNVLQDILAKIGAVIRFMAGFSMLTGLIVLIASVLISKFQRIQESVLLRTLGASRRQVLVITMLEYFFIGALAAVIGITLSMTFSMVLAKFTFEAVFVPNWWVVGGLFVGVSLLTVLIGLYNVRGVLNRPPLEVLRREG